jgi:hypothetical protein
MEIVGYSIMSDVNEFNAQTGEAVLRPYTEEELAQAQHDASIVAEPEVIPVTEDPVKLAALAKLTSLGLTEEEARAIAGL